ncbi:MAG: hypothetical protein ACJ72N_06750 [Labedaea sp.]
MLVRRVVRRNLLLIRRNITRGPKHRKRIRLPRLRRYRHHRIPRITKRPDLPVGQILCSVQIRGGQLVFQGKRPSAALRRSRRVTPPGGLHFGGQLTNLFGAVPVSRSHLVHDRSTAC